MTKQAETVICRFYRLIPEVPVPRPANRPADGMLPTRGVSVLRSPRVCLCIRVVYLSADEFQLGVEWRRDCGNLRSSEALLKRHRRGLIHPR